MSAIIGIDNGTDDKAAAHYRCANCLRLHSFETRPETLPLQFRCDCGAAITLDDPILRGLPE